MIAIESDDSFDELVLEGCRARKITSTCEYSTSKAAFPDAKTAPECRKAQPNISDLSLSSEDELPFSSSLSDKEESDESGLELNSDNLCSGTSTNSSTNESRHKSQSADDSSDDEAYERFLEKMKGANHRAPVSSDQDSESELEEDSLGDFIVPDDECISEGSSEDSVFYLRTDNLLKDRSMSPRCKKPVESCVDSIELSSLNLSDSPDRTKTKSCGFVAKEMVEELSSPLPNRSKGVHLIALSDSDDSFDELIKEGLHNRKLSQTPDTESKRSRQLSLRTPKYRPLKDSTNLDLSLPSLSEEEDVIVISEPVQTPAPKFTRPPPPGGASVRATSHRGMFTPAPNRTKKKSQLCENLSRTEPRLRRPQATFLSSLSAKMVGEKSRRHEVEKYVKDFNKHREELVEKLALLYNETVFDKKLGDVPVSFNKRLLKTAGICKYTVTRTNKNKQACVELSEKVCDSAERVRDTLIHELCHAAVWIVNGVEDGHGRYWQYWARKAELAHRDLPPIRRCHSYDITTKFVYKCTKCGHQEGRHSKSIDTEKKVCGRCRSKFELLTRSSKGLRSAPQSTPNKFAMFVKEDYGSVRKDNSNHKETMQKLSEQFSSRVKV